MTDGATHEEIIIRFHDCREAGAGGDKSNYALYIE